MALPLKTRFRIFTPFLIAFVTGNILYFFSDQDYQNLREENTLLIKKNAKSVEDIFTRDPGETSFPRVDWTIPTQHTRLEFWESIQPSYECPTQLLARVGNSGDGGKWTCGLELLETLRGHGEAEPCLVYSFGVSYDSSFEAEVLQTTHCAVYAYDMSVDNIGAPLRSNNPRLHFEKMGIAGATVENFKTFGDFLRQNRHSNRTIHVLKMDVEGSEFDVLKQMLEEFPEKLPIGQLLVELHIWEWRRLKDFTVKTRDDFIDIVQRLEDIGMRMFSREPNTVWAKGRTSCEFSFLNVNMI